ncbi:MAG: 50S ribosomal protein L5 [Leptospiraceae bacterium]|nr:50S ribosomal protein L5 [Leptospiraceae bacterium]MCB1202047.1 50S ribosomal protein L5 [Leptospiraceae bacterium]
MATTPARLQTEYREKFRKELKEELSLTSIMQVPELKKIVINVGAGKAIENPKILDSIVEEIGIISGQKAVKTKAKKSIAAFKLREQMNIGAMVTLRGKIMYEFLDRLINVALPRVRDFNGLSAKSFDKAGNYTLGVKEQIIFPEINFDKVASIHGMDITLVIKTDSVEHSAKLLEKFNFPIRKKAA